LESVVKYFKERKETGKVKERLTSALQSIEKFENSIVNAKKVSHSMLTYLTEMSDRPTPSEQMKILNMCADVLNDFCILISSICDFGNDCNQLVHFKAFMDAVKRTKGDVYDIIDFFARNYDSQKRVLDLNDLPMLLRLYGKKGGWEESEKLNEEVGNTMGIAVAGVDKLMAFNPLKPGLDRKAILRYTKSLESLVRQAKRLKADKNTLEDLKNAAPKWFLDIAELIMI
jgi:hypothetical protein